MGNEFEVWAFTPVDPEKNDGMSYRWFNRYEGENFDEAIETMKEVKKEGIGCVKLEWR